MNLLEAWLCVRPMVVGVEGTAGQVAALDQLHDVALVVDLLVQRATRAETELEALRRERVQAWHADAQLRRELEEHCEAVGASEDAANGCASLSP